MIWLRSDLYNFQKAIYRREMLCQYFLQRSIWLKTTLTFLFFMNWKEKRGWFVRFTLIRAKFLGVCVCVFFFFSFLRNKLKWQVGYILVQIITQHQCGYQHKLAIYSGLWNRRGKEFWQAFFKILPSKIIFFSFFWWSINNFWTIWAIPIFCPTFFVSFYTPLITICYVFI